jgi:hypothetical protein
MCRRMVPLLALLLGLAAGSMPGRGQPNRPPVRTAIPHEDDPIPPVGPCQGAHARAKAAEQPRPCGRPPTPSGGLAAEPISGAKATGMAAPLPTAIPHEDAPTPFCGVLPRGPFQDGLSRTAAPEPVMRTTRPLLGGIRGAHSRAEATERPAPVRTAARHQDDPIPSGGPSRSAFQDRSNRTAAPVRTASRHEDDPAWPAKLSLVAPDPQWRQQEIARPRLRSPPDDRRSGTAA